MTDTFLDIYEELWYDGEVCMPRGMKVKEIRNAKYTFPPYYRITSYKERKLNLDYLKWEFLWYLRADPKDAAVADAAQMWKDLRQPDGSYFSNYGQYWFGPQAGFFWALGSLLQDKDSRQAIIPMLNTSHLYEGNKDVVCTYGINFCIRSDELHMTVHMRSNDAIWGLTNDAACFSFLHEMMHVALKAEMPELKMGTYTHIADSLHVYERHFEMLRTLATAPTHYKVEIPRIISPAEVYHMIRYQDKSSDDDSHNPYYRFFRWLLDNKYEREKRYKT